MCQQIFYDSIDGDFLFFEVNFNHNYVCVKFVLVLIFYQSKLLVVVEFEK